MKCWKSRLCLLFLSAALTAMAAAAQPPVSPYPAGAPPVPPPPAGAGLSTAILEWSPPALAQLSAQAVAKESFTLDKTMLAAAAGMLPDSDADVRQAAAKLDGVSVHLLRFAEPDTADPALIESIRESYHLRGWKHVVSSGGNGGPVHDQSTDVWLVMDGANVRGAVVLLQSPKSLTLATIAGNLNPVDILHLRGHFGIPRFDDDKFPDDHHR